jgi:DNA primase
MDGKLAPNAITDQMIEQARAVPIETMAGLEMKRAGRLLRGRCPLHADGQERTPSFTVYPDGGGFFCFGCGKGGDSIEFVRLKHGLNFTDAVRFLAGGTTA